MKLNVLEDGTETPYAFDRAAISIGRAPDNDVVLKSSLVSRHHCRIEHDERGTWLADLGSANGTSVNGERAQTKRLAVGDRLQVGQVRIEVVALPAGEANPNETQEVAVEADLEPGLRTLSGDAADERDELHVFARITRELVRETDRDALLRLVVDSAVRLFHAERGFLLLHKHGAESRPAEDPLPLAVRVARSFDRADIAVPHTRLSLGIARKVWREGRALLSVDAGRDERFDGMQSVEDLRLRSVLCLPIRVEERVEGVLYVDNRLQEGAFSRKDLELADLLANQAGLAILNARRIADLAEKNRELAQSQRQVERLNELLGRKVRDRDAELAVVRAELGRERGRYDYTALVGASDAMRRVFQQLDRIVESELPVLISGESGTGKELIARAIHFNGPRRDKPFVSENCAALPDTLLESELFGHSRGAFTGAHRAKRGLFETASGGTLFLDEIGDMSAEMQKKLLRVLQEGELRPVGSDQRVQVDVRLVAASHRDLEALVRAGEFREDLYYRIHVLHVPLPPLRERREDIPLLAEHLLARAAREAGKTAPFLQHEVVAALVGHDWPGNVRELENEMRRLVVLAQGEVRLEHVSPSVLDRRGLRPATPGGAHDAAVDIRSAVADLERRSIEAALVAAGGNKSRAAAELGISRFALQRKLDKYGLDGGKVRADEERPE
ncbi:MAG: sigma 54-interacting transcriptional regulator [Planctomycetes bacterium]|nr:sigma 54-interacting transcriptional regulator [Planctomycetota bacterium]